PRLVRRRPRAHPGLRPSHRETPAGEGRARGPPAGADTAGAPPARQRGDGRRAAAGAARRTGGLGSPRGAPSAPRAPRVCVERHREEPVAECEALWPLARPGTPPETGRGPGAVACDATGGNPCSAGVAVGGAASAARAEGPGGVLPADGGAAGARAGHHGTRVEVGAPYLGAAATRGGPRGPGGRGPSAGPPGGGGAAEGAAGPGAGGHGGEARAR